MFRCAEKAAAQRRRRSLIRPVLELLEDRTAPATLTVNTLTDDVEADDFLTLREAITLVNAGTTADPGNGLGRGLTTEEAAQVAGTFGTSDRIFFASSPSTALTGTIVIAGSELPLLIRSMDIQGPGPNALAISGGGSFRVFFVAPPFIGEISGLMLSDGPGGSGELVENTGRLTVFNCVVGPSMGTGLFNGGESFLTVERSTIRNTNRGVENHGILTMTQCTVSGNARHGLFQASIFSNSATIRHCTFSNNASALVVLDAPGAGGIEVNASAEPVLLEHTIVAGNFRASYNPATLLTTNVPSDVRGAFSTNSRYNLIGVDGGITAGLAQGVNGNEVGTPATPIDALLDPLADNDSTTPTHALLSGSPARNAGDPNFVTPPATDQRGLPRVVDGRIDIGAFEDQTLPPPPPVGANIEGQTFLDLDKDGQRDPGEAGRDGWTIQLFDEAGNLVAEQITHAIDRDGNGVIEAETERGLYQFTGLAPGTYVVAEVAQAGATQTFPHDPAFGQRRDINVPGGPVDVAAADLDGDGDLDLAIAQYNSNGLAFHFGNGDGTFASSIGVTFAGMLGPVALAAADFDGDGDIDVAVANAGSDNVTVVRFQNGRVAGASSFPAGNAPSALIAADLDGDGDVDLATANAFEDSVSFLRNQGGGFFAAPNKSPVGDFPRALAAADLEGDGDLDLFVGNARDHNIEVLRSRGDGIFDGGSTFAVGFEPAALVAADLDGDGDPDLAAGGELATDVALLRNNGDRTFTSAGIAAVGLSPLALTAADLDNDGDLDLAAANTDDDSITILGNRGGFTFTSVSTLGVGDEPASLVAADFDGDGVRDLAVANASVNTVSLLRNLTGRHIVTLTTLDSTATGIDFGNVSRVQVVSGVRSELTAAAGSRARIPVQYTITDNDPTLSGLGVRLHFDSSFMTFDGLTGLLSANFLQQQVLADTQDFDSDPATDQYLLVSWADPRGRWPERPLPTRLFDAHFRLTGAADIGDTTTVRFSASSTAVTHGFAGIPIQVAVVPASLDVDQNGVADALSDGQMIVRSLFGFAGQTLAQDAVALDATRTDPSDLETYLEQIASVMLDADANGTADAMTDGALVQRYLFGFRGAKLVEGVVDPAGARTDPAAIVAFLDQFNPHPWAASSPAAAAEASSFATSGAGGRQVITPAPSSRDIASGGRFSIDVQYTTDPANAKLVGLGLRLHFDSHAVRFDVLDNLFAAGTPLVQVVDDIDDFDDDPATDKFVLTSFFDLLGRFPGTDQESPATLYAARFTAQPAFTGRTTFHFTASSTALGYTLDGASTSIDVSPPRVITWTAVTSGSWFDDSNWSGGQAPRSGDIAVIERLAPDLTVSVRGGDVFLQGLRNYASLEIADGEIDVAGDGVMPVTLGDVHVFPMGTFTVLSAPVQTVGPCGFENEGAFRILGGSLELDAGYTLLNRPGGVIDIAPGGGDPGLPGGGDPGLPGGGDPGMPGGGDPGEPAPGGGNPGLIADGATINNFGIMRIGGRGIELSSGAMLTNRSGASFGIDVADAGADPPGTGGGGSSDPPSSGGGTQPGGSPPGSGGGATHPKAGLSAEGSTIDNAGNITLQDGVLGLFGGAKLINRPGGIFEMPAPGGGNPGDPAPGGGDPGLPTPGSDPLPPSVVGDGSLLDNRAGGSIDLGSNPLEVRGGAVINSGALTTLGGFQLFGTLSGIGLINGDLLNAGIIRPGLSPGVLTINGDYTQTAAGVLELEVGGVAAGIDYDQLRVTGTSSLAGAQTVLLIRNFVPGPSEAFQFLSSAHVGGSFATTTVTAAAAGAGFNLDFVAGGLATFRPKAPTVERVVVNTLPKTSTVKNITIIFSEVVAIAPDAFRLRHKNGRLIAVNVVTRRLGDKTVAVLTFPMQGALPKGAYLLTMFAGRIRNHPGLALDGDGDGLAGGNRVAKLHSVP